MHINTVGFVGLTAVGTPNVLLPTAGGYNDPIVADRLATEIKFGFAGSLCVAAGAAAWWPLSWAGAALWAVPLSGLLETLWRREVWRWHRASVPLAAALVGFALVQASGILHAVGLVPYDRSLGLFFLGFLLPLVSGALSYLLPVWLWPGAQAARQARVRSRLAWGSGLRAAIFLAAALLWVGGVSWSIHLALAALAWFLVQTAWALLG
jgi:hypothetical protein